MSLSVDTPMRVNTCGPIPPLILLTAVPSGVGLTVKAKVSVPVEKKLSTKYVAFAVSPEAAELAV
jgi:hypothetical protein